MSIIGEIRYFPFAYAPNGWLPCDGRKLSSRTYPELSAMLTGRAYDDGADDGMFTLPFLQGSALVGSAIPDLPNRLVGYFYDTPGGVQASLVQMPMHSHAIRAGTADAGKMRAVPLPGDIPCRLLDKSVTPAKPVAAFGEAANLVPMGNVIQPAGGGSMPTYTPMQPFLTLQACICAVGQFPVRPTPPSPAPAPR